jgi:hypothetical protein
METVKRTIQGRDFWFTINHADKQDPETGELIPTGQYYCAFSSQEPGALIHGEILKDAGGRARLFPTPREALAAGVREVEARLRLPARAYAVGLPYGTKDAEYRAYLDLLRQQGIEVNGKSRVEDSFGRRWVHVWEVRPKAEQFAAQLRQVTGNRDWEVYDLSPPRSSVTEANEGGGPVVILLGRQTDGNTYSLHPNSLKLIRRHFPQVRPQPTVFIGSDTQAGSEAAGGPIYDQVAILLTGLSPEKLATIGGYRIVDPITDLVLYEADPAVR